MIQDKHKALVDLSTSDCLHVFSYSFVVTRDGERKQFIQSVPDACTYLHVTQINTVVFFPTNLDNELLGHDEHRVHTHRTTTANRTPRTYTQHHNGARRTPRTYTQHASQRCTTNTAYIHTASQRCQKLIQLYQCTCISITIYNRTLFFILLI